MTWPLFIKGERLVICHVKRRLDMRRRNNNGLARARRGAPSGAFAPDDAVLFPGTGSGRHGRLRSRGPTLPTGCRGAGKRYGYSKRGAAGRQLVLERPSEEERPPQAELLAREEGEPVPVRLVGLRGETGDQRVHLGQGPTRPSRPGAPSA